REEAMRRASAAAAIQVTRPGASQAMPTAEEVTAFLSDR
ncbi:ribokinase, partial [Cereibacter changlensis]